MHNIVIHGVVTHLQRNPTTTVNATIADLATNSVVSDSVGTVDVQNTDIDCIDTINKVKTTIYQSITSLLLYHCTDNINHIQPKPITPIKSNKKSQPIELIEPVLYSVAEIQYIVQWLNIHIFNVFTLHYTVIHKHIQYCIKYNTIQYQYEQIAVEQQAAVKAELDAARLAAEQDGKNVKKKMSVKM